MKRLFDEREEWTDEGRELAVEAMKLLTPLYKKWADAGYSIRDMQTIISVEANSAGGWILIKRRIDERAASKLARPLMYGDG